MSRGKLILKRIIIWLCALALAGGALMALLFQFELHAYEGKVEGSIMHFVREYKRQHGVFPADLHEFAKSSDYDSVSKWIFQDRKPRLQNVVRSSDHFEADLNYTAPFGSWFHISMDVP